MVVSIFGERGGGVPPLLYGLEVSLGVLGADFDEFGRSVERQSGNGRLGCDHALLGLGLPEFGKPGRTGVEEPPGADAEGGGLGREPV
jgi:hypothetical protein